MNQEQRINGLEEKILRLEGLVNDLSGAYYKNNFISSQTFNKDCVFNSRLKVPHYSSAPAISEVGDIIEIAGVLYICTVANTTFTKVASQ